MYASVKITGAYFSKILFLGKKNIDSTMNLSHLDWALYLRFFTDFFTEIGLRKSKLLYFA